MRLIRALPLALVLAVACSGKGTQPASLSAATVRGTTLDDSAVVVRRIAVDSGEFSWISIQVPGRPTRDGRYFSYTDVTGNLAVRDMRTGERLLLTSSGNQLNVAYAFSSLPSPNGRTLAFAWSVGKPNYDYELRTIGMDGSGERTLVKTGDPLEYALPADWSPDGRHLLAIMYRKDKSHQIAFVSATDGSVRVLKSLDWRTPRGLQLSPDGRWAAYDFQRDQENRARDLFILQADGSRETRITSDAAPKSLVGWSPDGLGLYYSTEKIDATTIWYAPVREGHPAGTPRVVRSDIWGATVIGFSGGALYYEVSDAKRTVYSVALDIEAGRALAPPAPIVAGSDVSLMSRAILSPDDNHLAFVRNQPGGPTGALIAIRDISTGAERQLPLSLGNLSLRHWLPDGRAIVALATRRGQRGLYRVDLATGTAELVEQVVGNGNAIPIPSPDGTTEYFVRGVSSTDTGAVVARSVQTKEEREIYRGREAGGLRLSPDGQSVALITKELRKSDAKETEKLVVIPAAGGEPHVLFSADTPRFIGAASLNWSPDSRHIVFRTAGTVGNDGQTADELWRATPRTGEAHKLLSVPTGIIWPVLSHDGRRVVYVASTGGRSNELWVMENLPGSPKKAASGSR